MDLNIGSYIRPETVFFLDARDKSSILDTLIQKATKLGLLKNVPEFKQALENRETLVSTGIGLGVAIPHAKLDTMQDFFVLTAILKLPVEWDSLDGKPVRMVFLIGGPARKHNEYLKLLSSIILVVKNDAKRAVVMSARSADQILPMFAES